MSEVELPKLVKIDFRFLRILFYYFSLINRLWFIWQILYLAIYTNWIKLIGNKKSHFQYYAIIKTVNSAKYLVFVKQKLFFQFKFF